MNVLLVYETPVKKILYLNQLQPLGILYLASFLESKGIKTDVRDYYVHPRKPIDYSKYAYIGYSMNSSNVENTVKSVKKVKQLNPNIKVVIGGAGAKIIKKKIIKEKYVDCVIVDEGEDIFYNYITKKDKKKVKGIFLKINGKTIYTGKSKPIDDLDSLPFPAMEKVPFKKYKMVLSKKKPVCAINTSRGCPHSCIFCHHSLGHKYRARSPENVVKEIIWLKKKGINEIWISDDSFTEDMKRAEKICDLIIEKKINISISLQNGLRVDRLNEKLLRKLKKAGVWMMGIAPEVGTESSLKKIRKGFTLKQVEKTVKLCKRIGIATQSLFIIGFPWEGKKEIMNTINFSKKLDADILCLNRLHPYPGTELWNMINQDSLELIDEKRMFLGGRYKHSKLTEKQIQYYIKKMNREFYTPRKVLNIAKILGPIGAMKMAKHAIFSRAML